MSWWGRIQRSLDHDALKKIAINSVKKYNRLTKIQSDKLSQHAADYAKQLSKQASDYSSQLSKEASDYGKQATTQLKRRASDYVDRFKHVPNSLLQKSKEVGDQARERTAKATVELQKKAMDTAKALPSKAAEAARGAAAAGTQAAKNAAQAGTQAASATGKRYANKAYSAIPDLKSYAALATRRVVYVLFGAAFLYGLGSSLPGAVSRYYIERDRRRDQDLRTLASRRDSGDEEAGTQDGENLTAFDSSK